MKIIIIIVVVVVVILVEVVVVVVVVVVVTFGQNFHIRIKVPCVPVSYLNERSENTLEHKNP